MINIKRLTNNLCLKNILNHPLFDIALFSLLLFLKYLYFFHLTSIEGELFLTHKGKVFTIVSLLLIGFLFYFTKSKTRKWALFCFYIFLTILMLVDTLYFRHFKDYTSFSLIYHINQIDDIKETIYQIVKWTDLLYFIDILLLGIGLIVFKEKIKNNKIKPTALKVILFSLVWSIVLYINVYASIDYSGAVKHRNTNSITSCQMGAINFHLLDAYDFIADKLTTPKLTKEKVEEIKRTFPAESSNPELPYWAKFKGSNVLIIQMESMSEYVMHQKIEGKEITPNLNKLTEHGYYANNFYSQVGDGHTSDAEFIVLNSLFPLSKGSVSVLYGKNDYRALPEILSEKGYYTFSAHGYREEFWNRVNMHKSLGFQESYFSNQFIINRKSGLGIKDEDFFVQSIEKIKELPKPFFSFFITLENHQPFEGRDKTFNVGELEGSKMGNYLQSAHEADKAIGILMNQLEANGLLEETIVILYGDHDAELPKEEMEKLFSNLSVVEMNLFKRVPFIMLTPKNEIVKVDSQPLGQIDIMPTILHLLGIEATPNLMYGENFFSYNEDKTVGTIKKRFYGKDYIFGNEENSLNTANAIDIYTRESRSITDKMIEMDNKYAQQVRNSDLLIRTNGIRDLLNAK